MNWTLRLSATAEADFEQIVDWAVARFGPQQAQIYVSVLAAAIQELHCGSDLPGAKDRSEIGRGICTVHAARHQRKARHFVIFRVAPDQVRTIDVIRILHDSKDLARHWPTGE